MVRFYNMDQQIRCISFRAHLKDVLMYKDTKYFGIWVTYVQRHQKYNIGRVVHNYETNPFYIRNACSTSQCQVHQKWLHITCGPNLHASN